MIEIVSALRELSYTRFTMTPRRWVLAIALLAAVAAFWTWNGSDRRQIGRQLERLQDLVSKSGAESSIVGLNRVRQITELFATPFEVRAEQLRFSTRDRQQLAGFIYGYRRGSERIAMRVSDTSLSIVPELGRATQHASFRFTGSGPLGAPSESYRLQINWLKEEAGWRIDYIDLLEIGGQ